MASTIKLKTGTGSAVPSALAQGEVGINIDNGLIYYGSGSGNAVKQLESFTHITASGDISSSGNISATTYSVNGLTLRKANNVINAPGGFLATSITSSNISSSSTIIADGINVDLAVTFNGNRRILYSTSDDNLVVQDSSLKVNSHITASGNISSSGTLIVQKNQFSKTSDTDADHQGDVVFFGGTTSMNAGTIYAYGANGAWQSADADHNNLSGSGLLGVALGDESDNDGMLLRGTVTLNHDCGEVGDVLYLSTTAGRAQNSAPSGNGDIVRVVGYCLDASNGQIWFNPDNTFVEVNA